MISIIVPVYNVVGYLDYCLDSILAQTYSDFELILIDDGSTDSSGLICDQYAEKDGRISVIHQVNKGLSPALNVGLDRAKGDYILMVDADDCINSQMVEILHELITSGDFDFAMCSFERIFSVDETITKSVVTKESHQNILTPNDCMYIYLSNLILSLMWSGINYIGVKCCQDYILIKMHVRMLNLIVKCFSVLIKPFIHQCNYIFMCSGMGHFNTGP